MKKLLFTAMLCFMASITLSAKPQKYHFMYLVGHESELLCGFFILDREAMTYMPESDSEVVAKVKNYKKSGNKETFDVYEDDYFVQSVELVTDEKGKVTSTFIVGEDRERQPTMIVGSTEEWEAAYERHYGKKPAGGDQIEEGNEDTPGPKKPSFATFKGKAKQGVKNVLNKGKNLFKKKN